MGEIRDIDSARGDQFSDDAARQGIVSIASSIDRAPVRTQGSPSARSAQSEPIRGGLWPWRNARGIDRRPR